MKIRKIKSVNLIAIALFIALLMSMCFTINIAYAKSADFQHGEGTESNPYLISTPEELNMVRYHRDAYFMQTANLDLSELENFAPIGSITFPFTGHYDGGKFSITNLTINSGENNAGLFSVIYNGTIENLKIKNSDIKGGFNVGAVAGTNKGVIIGCHAEADVSGIGAVGGIVGLNSTNGMVKECANYGTIKGDSGEYFGGISGINDGEIESCYNQGNINVGANDAVYSGGLVGYNNGVQNAEINKSYSIGEIGGKARGRIAGDNNGKIYACYFEESSFELIASFNNGQITETSSLKKYDFAKSDSFKKWNDFNSIWMYIDNGEYPMLTREYVAVETVEFTGEKTVKLKAGESFTFIAAVAPIHAMVQNILYEVIDDNDLAEFNSASNTITIKESAEIGSTITVKAIAEGHTALLTIHVVKTPVTGVEITSVTGQTNVSIASSLAFNAYIRPNNASYKDVKFSVNSSYATISEDGILTVKDIAPLGTTIVVTATSKDNGNAYDSMDVTIVGEPVQSVVIDSADSFKVTGSLILSAIVNPSNATNKEISYEIVSTTAKGAQIIGVVLYAEGLGEIVVKANADGVSSEEITVKVLKEPVTEIDFSTPDSIICGEGLPLIASAMPYNATYREVIFEIIENNISAEITNGVLYAKRDGTVVVRASADGVTIDKTIAIRKVPVETIVLSFADSFKHTQNLPLSVTVKPDNATYRDVTYSLIDNTADAYIENGVLYAERPGTVIIRAEADGESAEKTITVEKESVTGIVLTADYVEDDRGEALQFKAKVYPNNATYQDVTYSIKSGSATLTAYGYLLIDINAPIGSLIEVYAEADGVMSAIYEIRAGKVPVKSVTLQSDSSAIRIGQGAVLTVSTNPSQVSNPGITYAVSDGAEVIDGVLIVYDTALSERTVTVTAIVDGVSSNTIFILVEKTLVQALAFTCGTSFKITESLALSAKVYPADATYPQIIYTIVSDSNASASIIDGHLYAERCGVIKIRAVADGVTRELIVHATKEPVTDIVFTSIRSVKVNQELNMTSMVFPFNATYKSVRYELINNAIDAEICDGNVFYSSNVGTVTVRVYADDIYRDFTIEVAKEPVVDIKLSVPNAFKHTERLKLGAYVIPFNATYSEVSYEIIRGGDFAYISENYLYASKMGVVTLRLSADGMYVDYDVQVLKNAVTGVAFEGTSVFTLNSGYRSGEIMLNTIVSPSNATLSEVSYEIIASYNCVAEIKSAKLIVTALDMIVKDAHGYAQNVQATVTVRATADGVYTEQTYSVCKNEVENITITRELQTSPLTNGVWSYTDNTVFKTSGVMRFSVNVLSEFATYKDYIVEIEGSVLTPNNDGKYYIKANTPCNKTVNITSLCNGKSETFVFIIEEEEVVKVTLGAEIKLVENEDLNKRIIYEQRGEIEVSANSESSDIESHKDYSVIEVQQSSGIAVRPFARAANPDLLATNGNLNDLVLYYEVDGVSRTFGSGENNLYFSYDGSLLKIQEKAPVNKSFYLYATSKDGKVVSEKTQIIVQSIYIIDIREAGIDSNGNITGLGNLFNKDTNVSIIVKVDVSINHPSGIVINKSIATNDPTMRLQLYNPTLGGTFTISYTIHFEENGNSYSYTLEGVKTFAGIKANAWNQVAETECSAIILFDFGVGLAKSDYTIGENVKAIYVYGAGEAVNTCFNITNNSSEALDIYLNNIRINAPNNSQAIDVRKGNTNIIVEGTVLIYGGDGDEGSGKSGINSVGNVTLTGFRLNVYGGSGKNGVSGNNGSLGSAGGQINDGIGETGDVGSSGGVGINGYSGGSAITCKNLDISLAYLHAEGGDGGVGGNGGTGGHGGRGGDGRNGAFAVYSQKGGNGGDGGTGGVGGNGGDGGHGICATVINESSSSNVTAVGGDAGGAGQGGLGGEGGDGGNGGRLLNKNEWRADGVKGENGSQGYSGIIGSSGRDTFIVSSKPIKDLHNDDYMDEYARPY